MSRLPCSFCVDKGISRTFASQKYLRQHHRISHSNDEISTSKTAVCRCCELTCSFVTHGARALADHLAAVHSLVQFSSTQIFWESLAAFDAWKQEIETSTNCQYKRHTGIKESVQGSLRHELRCSRTTKASAAVFFKCTAYMLVIQENSGKCSGVVCLEHYGHDLIEDVPRQSLSQSFRDEAARRLKLKVSPRDVLKDLRTDAWDSYDAGGPRSREMYAVLQDIYNIRIQFKLLSQAVDVSESASLRAEADQQLTIPPDQRTLLFLKNKGEDLPGHPLLKKSHFMAVIQTEFQRDMLSRHGSKGVSIDATHGIAKDKRVKLVTLLVLDDCERGVPVAHFLTNYEDTIFVQFFLRTLRDQFLNLRVRWFLSDDADAFFNVWKVEIGGDTKKILCIWHVLKNVNQKLHGFIHEPASSRRVKSLFRAVMYASTQEECDCCLTALRFALTEHPAAVAMYLEDYYLQRFPQWALIYRVGSRLSTSGHIESFHRVFKRDHLQSVSANRLDDLYFNAINFTRETQISRAVFAVKNIASSRMKVVSLQHRAALDQLTLYEFKRDSQIRWTCTKLTAEKHAYVLNIVPCAELSCGIGCSGCANFCVHRISCECLDALSGFRYCKHAHLLCVKLMELENSHDLTMLKARPQQFGDSEFETANINVDDHWEPERDPAAATPVAAEQKTQTNYAFAPYKLLSPRVVDEKKQWISQFINSLTTGRTAKKDKMLTDVASFMKKLDFASRLDKLPSNDVTCNRRGNAWVRKQKRRHTRRRRMDKWTSDRKKNSAIV